MKGLLSEDVLGARGGDSSVSCLLWSLQTEEGVLAGTSDLCSVFSSSLCPSLIAFLNSCFFFPLFLCLSVFHFSLSLSQGPFLPLPLFLSPPVCLCLPSSLPLSSLTHAPLSIWLLCVGPGPLGFPTRELRGVRGTKGPSSKLLSYLLGQALPLRNA